MTKEQHEKYGEKQEMRRQEQRQRRAWKYAKWSVVIVFVVAFVALLVWWISRTGAKGPDHSVGHLIQGAEHIIPGTVHPEYNSNPPSSGWHYASTAQPGFHDDPIDDHYLIHNLEHGDIWIAYHPRIGDEGKEQLRRFVDARVVIAPRTQNDADIALVAWGRVDAFDFSGAPLDEQRVEDFIKRYINRGPEKVPPPVGGSSRF